MRRIARLLRPLGAALTAAAVVTACGGDSMAPGGSGGGGGGGGATVSTVEVSPGADTLVSIGETVQLSATAKDAAGGTVSGQSFTWNTSDPNVASVSSSGLVTAVGNGPVTISATASSQTGNAALLVAQQVANVAVSPGTANIAPGETQQFTAAATDANSNPVTVKFLWLSLDQSVATVDTTGLATGKSGGNVVISAVGGGAPGNAVLTVGSFGTATQLAFRAVPALAVARKPFSLQVEVQDAQGNIKTNATKAVTLEFETNAGSMMWHTSGLNCTGSSAFNSCRQVLVDVFTPEATPPLADTTVDRVAGVTYDPSTGMLLATELVTGAFITIDPVTGAQTVADTTVDFIMGLAFENGPGGRLLGVRRAGFGGDTLYQIDPANGDTTQLGPIAIAGEVLEGFFSLATDPTTGTIYGVARFQGAGSNVNRDLVTINPNTLVATHVGTLSEVAVSGIDFLPDGSLYAATGAGAAASVDERIWSVDKTSGQMTEVIDLSRGAGAVGIATVPARLSGTLTVNAVNGVATFTGLQINAPASGYTLKASGANVSDATSDVMTIITP